MNRKTIIESILGYLAFSSVLLIITKIWYPERFQDTAIVAVFAPLVLLTFAIPISLIILFVIKQGSKKDGSLGFRGVVRISGRAIACYCPTFGTYPLNSQRSKKMKKIDWVKIPAGKFRVGLDKNQLRRIRKELGETFGRVLELDLARHDITHKTVELPTFYIAQFPVTHAQMDAFFAQYPELNGMRVQPSPDALPNFPEEASWRIADLFSHWVDGRLPTANEWEKAARGTTGWLYPWGNKWDASCANITGSPKQPGYPEVAKDIVWTAKTPVDGYPTGASPYGVWDMVGNVQEWTMTVKPLTHTRLEGFVVKGKSAKTPLEPVWYSHITAHERVVNAHDVPFYIGFRPVKDVWEPQLWVRAGLGTALSESALSRVWENDEDAVYDDL